MTSTKGDGRVISSKGGLRSKRLVALALSLFTVGLMLFTPLLTWAQAVGGYGTGVGTGIGAGVGTYGAGAGVGGVGAGNGYITGGSAPAGVAFGNQVGGVGGVGAGLGTGVGAGVGSAIGPGTPLNVAPLALNDILAQPAAFLGRLVRTRGQISSVVGRNLAVLNDVDMAFDREILLFSPTDFSAMTTLQRGIALRPGMIVSVTGWIVPFNPQLYNQILGVSFNQAVLGALAQSRFVNQPAILAWYVETGSGVMMPGVAPIDLSDVLDSPAAFLGRLVRTRGQIASVVSRNVAVLNDVSRTFNRQILVVSPTDFSAMASLPRGVALRPGMIVSVTGWVVPFNVQGLNTLFDLGLGTNTLSAGQLQQFVGAPTILTWFVEATGQNAPYADLGIAGGPLGTGTGAGAGAVGGNASVAPYADLGLRGGPAGSVPVGPSAGVGGTGAQQPANNGIGY